jgi:YidC/Oxa1 family membrane protein insertase
MDKRAFLAIALSILVLVIYQEWVSRYYGTPNGTPTSLAPEAEKKAPEKTVTNQPAPAKPAESQPVAIPSSRGARDIRIETDNYVALFTNQGARLKSFKFKKYRSSVDEESPPFEIVESAPGVPFPFGVQWHDPTPFDDRELLYSVEGSDLKLTGDSKGTLIFRGQTGNRTAISKTFTFSGSTYPIEFEVSTTTADGNAPSPEIILSEKNDHEVLNQDAKFEGFVALVDNKIRRESPAEAAKGQEFIGDVSWEGFGYTYFFIGLLPANGAQHRVSVRQSGPALVAAISSPAGTSGNVQHYTVFIGPKELDILKSVGKGLERCINFGYFGFISIPFLYVLHFFHGFTGSYGIDIILLTVLIKLLMAPLTHKSFVSMKQMQKLQPQMERLKEKFKDDKEKLNKEIMELYRRNGVNPLGGCLPMVLQLPVFYGLYSALSTPIELRHAPFLWIKDLSRPDWQSLPFTLGNWHLGVPVLTLLMGASMFLQQWMTPSAGDPNQRKMMLMMPLIFTFMFVSFPAGLTVYWLVNNLLTIGQQYWINRRLK